MCDNSNDRVRKIDMETGIVTTVLGNGQRASNGDGGPATEASTLMPDAICVDVHGNLYVGEKYGFRVRRVDAETGIVTTIAGTGVPGMGEEGVKATETEVNSVEVGVWADPDGTVFYSDCGGRTRRIDAETGIVTTVLAARRITTGRCHKCLPRRPRRHERRPDGQIYIADIWNQRIRAIDPSTGVIRTVAGNGARAYGGDGGPATEAYLGNPNDVSVDAEGTLVIADTRHGHVRRVDADGIIHNVAGAAFQWDKGDGGPASTLTSSPSPQSRTMPTATSTSATPTWDASQDRRSDRHHRHRGHRHSGQFGRRRPRDGGTDQRCVLP